MKSNLWSAALLLVGVGYGTTAGAHTDDEPPATIQLSFAPIYSDHMVLQRDRPIPVTGTAKPGAEVSVELAGQVAVITHADVVGQLSAAMIDRRRQTNNFSSFAFAKCYVKQRSGCSGFSASKPEMCSFHKFIASRFSSFQS